MTERLADVAARLHSVRQLSAVVGAMRGIAAARSREARTRLDGIRAYARTVGVAIGEALALAPPEAARAPTDGDGEGLVVIALCAEQGFVGTFNARLLDAVARRLAKAPGARLLLVGARGAMEARERGLSLDWSAGMVAHVGEAAALAGAISSALDQRIAAGARRVVLIHGVPGASATLEVVEKALVPFDFARFPVARSAQPPAITLPPALLLARLVDEYVFAELCEAVILSFAAENEARMRAMIAAAGHVSDTLDQLSAHARQIRQEEITNEIIELAGGSRR